MRHDVEGGDESPLILVWPSPIELGPRFLLRTDGGTGIPTMNIPRGTKEPY